ncbi:MAG: HAD family hydrolase [Lachnospiraceae bacterium]|nr:HAD family hydrolase [Lachnospiraceae bacterium]
MYKNYIFDLYGTLVDINTNEWKMYLWEKMRILYGYYGAVYTARELKNSYEQLISFKEKELVDKGVDMSPYYSHESYPEIEIEYVFLDLFRGKGVDAPMELAVHAGQFFRALSTKYVKLYDGAKEMLEGLKAKGKGVYLLSNAQRIFTEYELKMLGIYDCFDGILISSSEGVKKPDVRFFEKIIDRYNLNPKECIMIGNDWNSDINGAHAAGMDSFYIHSNISPEIGGELKATYSLMEMDLHKVMEMIG